MTDSSDPPFWKSKTLEEMTEAEWESLCDGCGRCCLVKIEEEETEKIHFTDLGCTLLDARSCRCSDYKNRQARVHDCVKLTPHQARTLTWLPVTCAYRVLAEGGDLAAWHPLVSGRPESVHEAGVSVKGKVFASEDDVSPDYWPERIVKWPNRRPKRAKV
jgi:uncharacterized protein